MGIRSIPRYPLLWLLSILLLIGCAHNSGIHEAETAWKFAVVSDTQGDESGQSREILHQ